MSLVFVRTLDDAEVTLRSGTERLKRILVCLAFMSREGHLITVEFDQDRPQLQFAAWGMLVFGAAYAVQWLFLAKFGAHNAARYLAFLQNTLMSGLFVQMILARRGLRGQTLAIALAKWIGTLAPTILIGARARA